MLVRGGGGATNEKSVPTLHREKGEVHTNSGAVRVAYS